MTESDQVPTYDELLALSGQLLRDYGPEAVERSRGRHFGPIIQTELARFRTLVEDFHNPNTELPIGVASLHDRTTAKARIECKYLQTPVISIGILSYYAGQMVGEALNIYDGRSSSVPSTSIVRANGFQDGKLYKMELVTPPIEDEELLSLQERLRFASTIAPDAIRAAHASSVRRSAPRTKNATRRGPKSGLDDLDQ